MPRPLCPRCSREYVKRVSRVGLGERLISLFYVYPFRCQLCGHRFQLLQWGVEYKRSRKTGVSMNACRRVFRLILTPARFRAGVGGGYFDGRVHIPHGSRAR